MNDTTDIHLKVLRQIEANPSITQRELAKHKLKHKDTGMALFDAGVHDYEILKLLDLDKFYPLVVLYEHAHLDKEDYRASAALLRKHKYKLTASSLGTLAVQQSLRKATR